MSGKPRTAFVRDKGGLWLEVWRNFRENSTRMYFDIGGSTGVVTNRKPLMKYCNQWWPLYKLEDGEKWPRNGTLKYDILLQLMLFLGREERWDEVL